MHVRSTKGMRYDNFIKSGMYNMTKSQSNNFMSNRNFDMKNNSAWKRYSSFHNSDLNFIKQKKSGITAIDTYYDNLNVVDEVECLRYSTEFRRLITMIQNHWKAKQFPKCEQTHVNNVITQLVKSSKSVAQQEDLINQLEDYYRYIYDFTKLEQQLNNQIDARYNSLKHL